jgi:predicted ATPase
MSLARLLQRQGRDREAFEMLNETYGWFAEGFETGDLREAKTLLDQLSAAS